jgi:hypothetical protein
MIENEFNSIVYSIQKANRNENGPGPLKSDDSYFVERLLFHKELSGRSEENFLTRVLEISKQEL